jgi:chorismate synthase
MPDTVQPSKVPATPPSSSAPRLDLRRVASWAEYRACVELQREVWGGEFSDQVPASLLSVAQRVGGVTAGAFEPDGRLVGFVFGISGVLDGRLVHWSDLMAVRADARDRGVGRQLKMFQRDLVRAMGGTTIYWTYDPLVARNAYLNFMTLGVQAVEYVVDMYGSDTGSILHRGLGTDRLIVAWALDAPAPHAAATRYSVGRDEIPLDQIRVLNAATDRPETASTVVNMPPYPEPLIAPWVGVAIPADIHQVREASREQAVRWRTETRAAFQWAFANGYRIGSFRRIDDGGTGLYVLAHRAVDRPA